MKVIPVFDSADFVKHFAEAVEIGLWRARTLWRDEARGAHKGSGLADVRDQADVGQLGHAVHENDVRRLNVAMDESVPVNVRQSRSHAQTDIDTLSDGQAAALFDFFAQRARRVRRR